MRVKGVLIAAAGGLLTAAAWGTNWHLNKSFPAPPNVRGFSYLGGVVLCDGTPPRVWHFDDEGRFFNAIDINVPRGAWGVSWNPSGNNCWISHQRNSYIYRVNSNGSVMSSFPCPHKQPAGLTRFKVPYGDMAVCVPDDNLILFLTDTGSLVGSQKGPGTRVTAAFFFGARCFADAGTKKVYTWDRTFNVAAAGGLGTNLPMHGRYANVYLTDTVTNTFQYWDWGGSETAAPASLGRVKALFQ